MSTEQGPKGSIYQQFTNNMKLSSRSFVALQKKEEACTFLAEFGCWHRLTSLPPLWTPVSLPTLFIIMKWLNMYVAEKGGSRVSDWAWLLTQVDSVSTANLLSTRASLPTLFFNIVQCLLCMLTTLIHNVHRQLSFHSWSFVNTLLFIIVRR